MNERSPQQIKAKNRIKREARKLQDANPDLPYMVARSIVVGDRSARDGTVIPDGFRYLDAEGRAR